MNSIGRILFVMLLTVMLAFGGAAPASAQRVGFPTEVGTSSVRSIDILRLRRLGFEAELGDGVRGIEMAVTRAARRWQAQDSQEETMPASSSSGRRRVGAVGARAIGTVLFGWLLSRGPTASSESTSQPWTERDEFTSFGFFAGAVTLMGAGAVVLLAGS